MTRIMEETISVTDFKAKCLDILKRLGRRQLERVTVTRHGEVVAVITPPPSAAESIRAFHGSMKDRTIIPPGFDLTAPVLDEELDAERGILHR
jgi:antitoxin (DNA-binding transcriptional repressor) of toxin-antitoxin stability system